MSEIFKGSSVGAFLVAEVLYCTVGTRDAVLTWLAMSAAAALIAIAHKGNNQS